MEPKYIRTKMEVPGQTDLDRTILKNKLRQAGIDQSEVEIPVTESHADELISWLSNMDNDSAETTGNSKADMV